jgi:hypothetical protein
MYEPSIGRFLQRDPVPAMNPFEYVNGRPTVAVDPMGTQSRRVPGAAKDGSYQLLVTGKSPHLPKCWETGSAWRYRVVGGYGAGQNPEPGFKVEFDPLPSGKNSPADWLIVERERSVEMACDCPTPGLPPEWRKITLVSFVETQILKIHTAGQGVNADVMLERPQQAIPLPGVGAKIKLSPNMMDVPAKYHKGVLTLARGKSEDAWRDAGIK